MPKARTPTRQVPGPAMTFPRQSTQRNSTPCPVCGTNCGKPTLLDLFSGAGGAARGYQRAGFCVLGVDIKPQPHSAGCRFVQADALTYPLEGFDAYHASPPCQFGSTATQQWRKAGREYENLIPATRERLQKTGKHYVIENVVGEPYLKNPLKLNGAFFGKQLRRTRYFETSFPMEFILLPKEPPSHFRMGRPVKEGDIITPVGHFSNVPYARSVMAIDWMNQGELAQAIPPAYTEYIGKYLMIALRVSANTPELPLFREKGMTMIDLTIPRGAIFSEDRRYRYCLWRVWNTNPRMRLGIGLNPSTANEVTDDPTITRWITRAARDGFGGILFANLYAYVSTNPADLLTQRDSIGPENDRYLREMIGLSSQAVCCWGSFRPVVNRAPDVLRMIPQPFCLGVNQDGQPKHPLYVGYNVPVVEFAPTKGNRPLDGA